MTRSATSILKEQSNGLELVTVTSTGSDILTPKRLICTGLTETRTEPQLLRLGFHLDYEEEIGGEMDGGLSQMKATVLEFEKVLVFLAGDQRLANANRGEEKEFNEGEKLVYWVRSGIMKMNKEKFVYEGDLIRRPVYRTTFYITFERSSDSRWTQTKKLCFELMSMKGLHCFECRWGLSGKQKELAEEILQNRALDVAENLARQRAANRNLYNVVPEALLDNRTIRKDSQRSKNSKINSTTSTFTKAQLEKLFKSPPIILSFLQLSCTFLAW